MSNIVYDNEITVELSSTYDELKDILKSNGFKLTEEYDLIDIYMLKVDYQGSDILDKLKNCLLIRNIITKDQNIKLITYKYKEYNDREEIVKQGKVECEVSSISDAQNLLETVGYRKFINIIDHIKVYNNGKTELAVQLVNDKHIYIELEQGTNYDTVEEMIEDLNSYNFPLKNTNYFVKKALIEILESGAK